MATYKVAMFRPYPLGVGQKIRIDGGPRRGDWKEEAMCTRLMQNQKGRQIG